MRKTVILFSLALWGAIGAAPAQAQQESTQQPSRPVFSLPPGDPVEEQPDPNVQGPRAPGVPAPRVIDPNAPREESRRAQQTRTQPPPTTQQTAPERNAQADPPAAAPRGTPTRQSAQALAASGAAADRPLGDETAADGTGDFAEDGSLFDYGSERTAPADTSSAPGPAVTPSAEAETGRPPIWLIGLALLIAAGLGYVFWRRRAQPIADTGLAATEAFAPQPEPEPSPEPEALPEPAPEPEPLAAAPSTSAPVAPSKPAAAQLELHFEPLEARWSEAGLTLAFRLYLRNISDQPVHEVAVHLGIRSADRNLGPSQGRAGLPNLFLDTLKARDMSAHEGEMRLDDKAITPVMVDGREMVLPVVDIMPCYRDSADAMRKIEVALLVGRERNPPAEKLAPLPVRTALGPSERLGCRNIVLPGA
ncbi:MAG: hypothetical protein LC634_08270, partial [Sphingomonadales bacterium]|nr:hypothetical protein [Sphingomonadales bacterium]